jgi:hypothetical protein
MAQASQEHKAPDCVQEIHTEGYEDKEGNKMRKYLHNGKRLRKAGGLIGGGLKFAGHVTLRGARYAHRKHGEWKAAAPERERRKSEIEYQRMRQRHYRGMYRARRKGGFWSRQLKDLVKAAR